MPAGRKVFRFDAPMGGLGKTKKMRGGALRVDGHFTKPGVFPYTDESGRTVMEYRPTSEVFAPASIESWKGVPITDGHPGDLVTDATWADHAIGQLGDDVRIDGDKLLASHVFQRRDAVRDVENRTKGELSGGYWIDLDSTPGVTAGDPHVPDGIRYDRVHRGIEGNHVASLAQGDARLGRDMALRLDAKGNQISKPRVLRTDSKETHMKITFLGKQYDLESEGDRALLGAAVAEHAKGEKARTDAAEATVKERDTTKAALDVANAKIVELTAALAKANDPKVRADEAAAVAKLDADCKRLAPEVKLDGLDPAAKKKATLEALKIKLEGERAEPGYIKARFDAELERLGEDATRTDEAERHVADLRVGIVEAQHTTQLDGAALLRAAEQKQRDDSAKAGQRAAQ